MKMKDYLLTFLKHYAYKKGDFTLSSGKKSEHYINCKPVILTGVGLDLTCRLMLEHVNTPVVAVAEAPFGGIKQTGYGREGGSMGIKDYLNVKYTHLGIKG